MIIAAQYLSTILNDDPAPTVALGAAAEWVGAIGTFAAFVIAAVVYASSVRTARQAQARRVSVRLESTESIAAGSIAPLPSQSQGLSVNLANRTWVEDAFRLSVEVVNGSDEIIGPVRLNFIHAGQVLQEDIPLTLVQANSSASRTLYIRDVWTPNVPGIIPRVVFRDSSGRWWQRIEGRSVTPAASWLHWHVEPDELPKEAEWTVPPGHAMADRKLRRLVRWLNEPI